MSSQLPFGLTLLLLLAGAAQAEVQVWVEPRLADELDPITLTLRATDADIGDEPDLSVLQDDFEVLNQQRISRSQIIRARQSRTSTCWRAEMRKSRPSPSGSIFT